MKTLEELKSMFTQDLLELEKLAGIWPNTIEKRHVKEQTRTALLTKGFVRSMSRAGTPTDNGYAERFVGIFKLAIAERRSYRTRGEFLREAEHWINFYNQTSSGHMRACISSRLITMPEIMACQRPLICPYFNVQFFGYLT